MANMSYCRFHNTAGDLRDCVEAMEEQSFNGEHLSDMEISGRARIIELAKRIADNADQWLEDWEAARKDAKAKEDEEESE
jgi:hypothetical protein